MGRFECSKREAALHATTPQTPGKRSPGARGSTGPLEPAPIIPQALHPQERQGRRCHSLFNMSLTLPEVQRLAQLARLELSAAEQQRMLDQLNGFFAIVEQMRSVDTRHIEPLHTPLSAVEGARLRLRDDEVSEGNEREAHQRSAPAVVGGLYLVPKVIE